jgi:hypothetical protein
MPFDLASIRKMIEGEDAENTEIYASKVTLTVDISIMTMETQDGKPYYSTSIYFPPDEDPDADESDHEAVAGLVWLEHESEEITSLDETIRLLGISPDAQVWESEQ